MIQRAAAGGTGVIGVQTAGEAAVDGDGTFWALLVVRRVGVPPLPAACCSFPSLSVPATTLRVMQPDMRNLMKQAAQMQEQLLAAQNEMATREFEGSAGGGVVRAVVTGGGQLTSMHIDPSVIDPDDAEMLGDLVVAAINHANQAVTEASSEHMGGLSGGLDRRRPRRVV